MKIRIFLFILTISIFAACKNEPAQKPVVENKPRVKIPAFNADSAYQHIKTQLDFGFRVPGTPEHKACRDWFVKKFESYGADVIAQDFIAEIYNGEKWASSNIIAQFNPDHKDRVILSAHWDSRFIAEEDPDRKRKEDPIPGADDGASGVGVLIEIGRVLQENPIDMGIDIILWDAEDQGERSGNNYSWCLGSQHWSKNKHKKNYRAKYGINLDMVGAANPRFGKDQDSRKYAGNVINKIWQLAQNMGYSDMFVNENTEGLLDDHTIINTMARIPMIDIINQPNGNGFVKHWHTHGDDLSTINKRTLRVVGQVVTAAMYKESDGSI